MLKANGYSGILLFEWGSKARPDIKKYCYKNMEGNRAKQNKEGIWRYRALTSDYYIFKHEYIFIFKN